MLNTAAPSTLEHQLVELTSGLCRIPSPLGEEGPVAEYLAKEIDLLDLGFDVELQEVVRDRYNVVAISRGDPGYRSILLNGHLDASLPGDDWRHDPFDPWVEDGILYGAGIQDMKGGVAALVLGAAEFVRSFKGARGDVVISAVMNHDTTGLGTKFFLESCPWRLDAGVNAEPTDLKVQLFHGGAWCFHIETFGTPRHQVYAEQGIHAVEGMLRIFDRVRREALTFTPDPAHPELPRVIIGIVSGGEKHTSTAERCEAWGDIRYLPGMSIDSMKSDIRRIADEVCTQMPGLRARVRTWRGQWPYEVSAEDPVVQALINAHTEITGRAPERHIGLPMSAAITDTADMIRHDIPTVLYGPSDWRTEPNEGMAIADLVTAAQVYARTCQTLTTRLRA